MARKLKAKVEEPVLEEKVEVQPEPPKVEKLNYEVVDINGKLYKKFRREDGTTYVELI